MNDPRPAYMPDPDTASFIRDRWGAISSVDKLMGDASAREYFRVRAEKGTSILCRDAALRGKPLEDYHYAAVHRLFTKQGIPMADVYRMDNATGVLLLEDLGDLLLEEARGTMSVAEEESVYRRIIDILVRIQSVPDDGSIPFGYRFDSARLMFEFDYFLEHMLNGYLGAPLSGTDVDALRADFTRIASILDRGDLFVLNHRDYQSRNIMLAGDAPYVIDFQDARPGLPQYDLVSLLRDPYAVLDPGLAGHLTSYYFETAREKGIHRMGRDEFDRFFDIMAFQRVVKALGTYGFQSSKGGKKYFAEYIPPATGYVRALAARRDELKRAGVLIDNAFGGAR
ncbi:MAG: aminoglycoside phosphotransferase [Spirochaetes bacterium]|nr:MAG: aminoglycoside phosphotransferase [Spirochaetota bacterium]